ncbi:MAG: hypothetical protein HYZ65_15880 [Burkholderiales bacterium]|nr:hypothetical protein [Burkholderiales bacterium]
MPEGFAILNLDRRADDIRPRTSCYFVNRRLLERQDPAATLSEPELSLVYWLDKNIPEKYRKSILEVVLERSKAFEKMGFKNAVQARRQA